ncbi:MAG: hypothetical protein SFX72_00010 [Isosphaeraceae bacterium]|nr:hypothetical protein [Isosphaeraceae bacterium]
MKQAAFWIVVGLIAVNLISRHESRSRREHPAARESRQVVHEVRTHSGEHTIRTIVKVSSGVPEVRVGDSRKPRAPREEKNQVAQVKSEPGTTPGWFPKTHEEELAAVRTDEKGRRVILGPLSASASEARERLRAVARRELFDALTPEFEKIDEPTDAEIDALMLESHVKPVLFDLDRAGLGTGMTWGAAGVLAPNTDDLYTIYKAGGLFDFSEAAKHRILEMHHDRMVRSRIMTGAGVFGFSVVGLGLLSGYLRADLVTQGRHRRKLRLLGLGVLAAAGVGLMRWMA